MNNVYRLLLIVILSCVAAAGCDDGASKKREVIAELERYLQARFSMPISELGSLNEVTWSGNGLQWACVKEKAGAWERLSAAVRNFETEHSGNVSLVFNESGGTTNINPKWWPTTTHTRIKISARGSVGMPYQWVFVLDEQTRLIYVYWADDND